MVSCAWSTFTTPTHCKGKAALFRGSTVNDTYIFLNLSKDTPITATPVMNPMTADNAMITSVLTATDGENSDHVWQLATQMPKPSGRKKFSWQGKRFGSSLVFREAVPGLPDKTTGHKMKE